MRIATDEGSDETQRMLSDRERALHITFRPARPDDAQAMRRLARAAFTNYLDRMRREPAPMQADYVAAVAGGHAWVAERQGELVGLLVLEPAADHLLLDIVAVAPGSRGLGIGGRLLRVAEQEALALGFSEVRLCTNEAMTENIAYYPRRGYRQTHRAVQDGYARVFFSKTLDPHQGQASEESG